MDGFGELMTSRNVLPVAGGIVAAAVVVTVIKKVLFTRSVRESNPRDLVILRQVGRGPHAPSLSPFPLKLETFLRMAKIPYQSVHSWTMSSKGKTPWIQYNDLDVADSAFCIEFINDKFGVDLNAKLSSEQKAVARAFEKMAEEGIMFWSLVLYRWVYPVDRSFMLTTFGWSPVWVWVIGRYIRKASWAQGSGRHSQREVDRMLEGDLKAVSDLLGDKEFLFGHTPTELDCCVFAFLCQHRHNMCDLEPEKIVETFPNLMAYCDRIKSRYWPDWNEKITHGKYCGFSGNGVIREAVYTP